VLIVTPGKLKARKQCGCNPSVRGIAHLIAVVLDSNKKRSQSPILEMAAVVDPLS
jgi:hypothetical protein